MKEEAIAVREANKLGIPVIALVDTNSNPMGIEYIIPANDDAMSSINYFASTISALIKEVAETQKNEKESQAPKTLINRVKKRQDHEVATHETLQVASEDNDAKVEEKKSAKVHTKKTQVSADIIEPTKEAGVKKVVRRKSTVEKVEKK